MAPAWLEHAHAAVKDLHRGGGGPHLHLLLGELIGHAVPVVVELDVVVDVDAGRFPVAILVTLAGKGRSAGLSSDSNRLRREPSRLRKGRWFSRASNSRMASFTSAKQKNFRFRSAARIQRSTNSTPASTFALSRGFRAGRNHGHAVVRGHLLVGRFTLGS